MKNTERRDSLHREAIDKETLAAERKDPSLRLRRKAKEGFIKIGMTAENAEQAVLEIEARRKATVCITQNHPKF